MGCTRLICNLAKRALQGAAARQLINRDGGAVLDFEPRSLVEHPEPLTGLEGRPSHGSGSRRTDLVSPHTGLIDPRLLHRGLRSLLMPIIIYPS